VVSGDLLAEPGDRAFVGAQKAGEAKEERRFPSARTADETNDLAAFDIEIHFAERGDRGGASTRTSEIGFGKSSDAKRAHLNNLSVDDREVSRGLKR
jgi:hypothetical protein